MVYLVSLFRLLIVPSWVQFFATKLYNVSNSKHMAGPRTGRRL